MDFAKKITYTNLGYVGTRFKPDDFVCVPLNENLVQNRYKKLVDTHMDQESAYRMTNGRMARSCGPHWSPNLVTHFNNFECHYTGVGLTDSGPMYMPFRKWKGTLASCDDGSLEISDELMRDVQLSAYHAADGASAHLDPRLFQCRVESVPLQ
jgi:hypothetical protein